jgi:hypothetical protein
LVFQIAGGILLAWAVISYPRQALGCVIMLAGVAAVILIFALVLMWRGAGPWRAG